MGLGVKGLRLASVIAGLRCDVERECDRCRESPRESEVTLCMCVYVCVCVDGEGGRFSTVSLQQEYQEVRAPGIKQA